ncbi:MAG: ABC transporter ATP-binding protein [Planctomycetota bacterium]
MVSLLATEGLSLGYADEDAVVEGLDFELRPGELVALIGPNGAGKSTVLRAFSGALVPRAGRVLVGGEPLARLPARERARRVAHLPQEPRGLGDLLVADFVAGGRYAHRGRFGGDPRGAAVCREALERVGLSGERDRLLFELSGGQQQRALLARALAQEAPALLVDEPTSSLDARHQIATFALLRELADGGRGVLAVTHDLNLASQFADRLLLLEAGRLRAQGSPEEVLRREVLGPIYGDDLLIGEAPSGAAGGRRPWVLAWRGRTGDAAR